MSDRTPHDNTGGMLPNQPLVPWEWRETAYRLIRQTADKIDADRRRVFQPRLAEVPLSREQWASKIKATLTGPQDVETALCAAAVCVAFVEALLRSEDGDPFAGAEAA